MTRIAALFAASLATPALASDYDLLGGLDYNASEDDSMSIEIAADLDADCTEYFEPIDLAIDLFGIAGADAIGEALGCSIGRDGVCSLTFILDGWDEVSGGERLVVVDQEEVYGPDNAGACAAYDLEVERAAVQRDGSVLVDGVLFDAACEERECLGNSYTATIIY